MSVPTPTPTPLPTPITLETRFDRLDLFISEGRIARETWGSEWGPTETACPIRALVPELRRFRVEEGKWGYDLGSVPSGLMPKWVAGLTVACNDYTSETVWSAWLPRYSRVMRSAVGLEDWGCVYQSFLIAIAEAVARGATPLTDLQTRSIAEMKAAIKARDEGYSFGAHTSRLRDLVPPLEHAYWREEDSGTVSYANAYLFLTLVDQFSLSTSPPSFGTLGGHRAALALHRAAGHPSPRDQPPREGWDILANLFLDTVLDTVEAKAEGTNHADD